MKTSVNLGCFLKKFGEIKHPFSEKGLEQLYQFLINEERKSGVERDLDIPLLCHQYTELEYTEIAEDYEIELTGIVAKDVALVRNYLAEHTIIVANLEYSFIYVVEC